MRIPAFLIEHPIETLLAGVLLFALLFGSADRRGRQGGARSLNRHRAEDVNFLGTGGTLFSSAGYLTRADVRSGTPPAPSTARFGCPLF